MVLNCSHVPFTYNNHFSIANTAVPYANAKNTTPKKPPQLMYCDVPRGSMVLVFSSITYSWLVLSVSSAFLWPEAGVRGAGGRGARVRGAGGRGEGVRVSSLRRLGKGGEVLGELRGVGF